MIGLDPRPFTLRQLVWMARGAWDRTAALMCTVAVVFGGGKARDLTPDRLNPYRQKRAKGSMKDLFGAGRQMLAERRASQGGNRGSDAGAGE